EKRVGDGLHEYRARRRAQRGEYGRGVGRVHEGGLHPEPPAVGGEIGRGGAVEITRRHHVITGGQEPEQPGGGGAHAGRTGHRRFGPLEARHQLLEHGVIAGAVAAVDIAGRLALPHRLHHLHVLEHVDIGLVDGRRERPAGGGEVPASPGGGGG